MAFLSADSFGAILEKPVDNAAEIKSQDIHDGSHLWASTDAPWLGFIDNDKFGNTLSAIENLNAGIILSSHLPPAENMSKTLLDVLSEAPQTPVFVGPDQ